MKKLKYLIFLLINVLIPIYANAKEIKMTCNYFHAYDQLSGNPEVSVKCDIYEDYSHKCYVTVPSQEETDDEENILNWNKNVGEVEFKAKEYVKNYNKCPDYLVVLANGGIFGSYELHAADSEENAKTIQTNLGGKRFPARNKELEYSEEEKKQAEENIAASIKKIKEDVDNYDLSDCKESDKVITRISECKKTIEALKNRIGSEEKNVKNYIERNILSEDDEIVKQFREEIEQAETFINSEQNKLDEEDKKIKEELELEEDEETSEANQGKWDPNKLCDNGDCNIDITKFCTNPYVSRTLKFLGLLIAIAKVLVPVIIIGLGFIDLVKIVISGRMEEAKKQGINIGKRIIIGIGIFIIPTILITIYNVAYSIANDKEQVTSGELNIPTNFKNCVGCVLDATNENSCITN